MSRDKNGDAVAEYLYELELRLSGLPVLQRRELLADLEAHITNERIERAVTSEGELLEILERLGSPEVVAAAAYEEAAILQPSGMRLTAARPAPVFAYAGEAPRSLPPMPSPPDAPPFGAAAFTAEPPYVGGLPFEPPPPPARPESGNGTVKTIAIGAAILLAVFILLGCLAGSFMLRSAGSDVGGTSEAPAIYAPVAPAEQADPPPAPVPTIGN